ncbi:MAG: YHYH domain-containing protein, partial [Pseudomonas sp.]|nr:YHYH domain-containing protein [Pseudomonas sp.]
MSMEQALMKLSALLIAALLSISSAAAFAHSG